MAEWFAYRDPRLTPVLEEPEWEPKYPVLITDEEDTHPSADSPASDEMLLRAVLEDVRAVAGERAQAVTAHTNIVELGLDSLERLEIVNRVESRFGGIFPESVLLSMETCAEVAEATKKYLVGPRLALAPPAEVPSENYRLDALPEYTRLRQTRDAMGLGEMESPYFRTYAGATRDTTSWNGQEFVSFSGYNYLGMSGHPQVSQAAKHAILRHGTSASASRLVSGQRDVHHELEQELASFLGTEDALVLVGGHATNVTTIGHLLGPGDLILHDSLAHNSIVQGALLSGSQRRPFPHNDWQALERMLAHLRGGFRRVLIAIEGVYSMDGDYPDLREFTRLKHTYRTYLLVDEAHSLGTMGPTGRGIGEHFGTPPSDVDIWMGTLSKALGSCGGYIAGSLALIDYMKHTAPGFVYSVGMAPPLAAAALAALRLLRKSSDAVGRCRARSRLFLELARKEGLPTGSSEGTPVIPVIVGSSRIALELSQRLLVHGIIVHPIMYP
ncbi:MAG TPA: aminotransferase class I/II-fold pyridoxal phosphate-dependent enzyme, partial [Pirellulaceae bacterium]